MLNHLINGDQLMFCKSCGRLLYLDELAEATSKAPVEPRSDRMPMSANWI